MTFLEAVAKSKTLKNKPSNDILLKLYGLYKQATEGNCTGEKPGGFDFVAAAKFAAWEAQKGKNTQQSEEEYIRLVEELATRD